MHDGGETVTCKNAECGREFFAIDPGLGQFRDPTGEPPRATPVDVPAGRQSTQTDGLGVARCPHCGTENKVLD